VVGRSGRDKAKTIISNKGSELTIARSGYYKVARRHVTTQGKPEQNAVAESCRWRDELLTKPRSARSRTPVRSPKFGPSVEDGFGTPHSGLGLISSAIYAPAPRSAGDGSAPWPPS
jgi:hypothetical protein